MASDIIIRGAQSAVAPARSLVVTAMVADAGEHAARTARLIARHSWSEEFLCGYRASCRWLDSPDGRPPRIRTEQLMHR